MNERRAELVACVTQEAYDSAMNRGKVAFREGDFEQAGALFRQALDSAQGRSAARDEARAFANLANVYAATGRQRAALRNYERSVARLRALGEVALEAAILPNIVECCQKLGKLEAALGYLSRELALARMLCPPQQPFLETRAEDARRYSAHMVKLLNSLDA